MCGPRNPKLALGGAVQADPATPNSMASMLRLATPELSKLLARAIARDLTEEQRLRAVTVDCLPTRMLFGRTWCRTPRFEVWNGHAVWQSLYFILVHF